MSRYPNLEQQLREFETQQYPTDAQTVANNASILYKRKKYFLDQLRQSFFFCGSILIVIVYLKDLSFVRFVFRGMAQYTLFDPYAQMTGGRSTSEMKKMMSKFILLLVLTINTVCIFFHLVFGVYTETSNADGYLQGGLTVQFIGERMPYSVFELFAYDFLIFGIQLVYHCLQCSTDDSTVLSVKIPAADEDAEEGQGDAAGRFKAKADAEGDGYTGDVFLLSIDVFSSCLTTLRHRGEFSYMDSFTIGQETAAPEAAEVVPAPRIVMPVGPTVGAYV